MNYIIDQILYSDLYIEPHQLKKNINDIILLKLKKKYEDLCYMDGFVIKDSIEIDLKDTDKISDLINKLMSPQLIDLDIAKIIYDKQVAIFVDARDSESY